MAKKLLLLGLAVVGYCLLVGCGEKAEPPPPTGDKGKIPEASGQDGATTNAMEKPRPK